MENNLAKIKPNAIGDQVIKRIEDMAATGFTMPSDYNYVNAIKASMLVLQSVKDKNGKPALEVCTPASIQTALFEMCIKGLNVARKQGYFIVRGNVLCFDEGYFGKVLQVKRIYPNFVPNVNLIYEGDAFEYSIDTETGFKKIIKHEQKLENIDKDFVGAYVYIPNSTGGKDLFMMTKKEILTAWSKSPNKSQTVHKDFVRDMVSKTVINSGCKMIINSTPELSERKEVAEDGKVYAEEADAEEFVDVPELPANEVPENVDTETGEVKQPEQQEQTPPQTEETDF